MNSQFEKAATAATSLVLPSGHLRFFVYPGVHRQLVNKLLPKLGITAVLKPARFRKSLFAGLKDHNGTLRFCPAHLPVEVCAIDMECRTANLR